MEGLTECRYGQYPATKGGCHSNHILAFYIWGAFWCHMVNTTEPSVCSSNAALCQITLTTCFILLLNSVTFHIF